MTGDRVAWAGLLRSAEPPCPPLRRLIDRVGPERAWDQVRCRTVPPEVAAATAARTDGRSAGELQEQAEADLAAAAEVGARLIIPSDDEWPVAAFSALRTRGPRTPGLPAAPLALWVRGRRLPDLPYGGVTVVGSRASTAYGQRLAGDLGSELASAGLTVVSGAAFGIDAAAHRGALGTSGSAGSAVSGASAVPTVAVLACGIDQAYPTAHRELIDRIGTLGALISEYAPGTRPARHRFLVRNRLIAALGGGTVVVEAGRRSGTLSTACEATELHRVVMALPGPVTSAMSVGCHRLIADDAALLVTSAADILSLLRPDRCAQPTLSDWPALSDPAEHPTDGLDVDTARAFDALSPRGLRTVQEVATESGVPGRAVLAALALLELRGLALRGPGGTWRRAVPRAPSA